MLPTATAIESKLDLVSPLTLGFNSDFKVLSALAAKAGNDKLKSFEFSNVLLQAKGSDRPQLVNCYGHTKANEILTILGPNKSDQLALIRVLAGREHLVKDLKSGRFIANESEELYQVMRYGLVPAVPVHMKTSTVVEEFNFAYALRFPDGDSNRDEVVADLLVSLNLLTCGNKQIGALAPWELQRVAVGVELLSLPNVLFVNLPLVDNRKADWEMIQILQSLQRSNICQVVVSLHAPSSEVFHLIANHFLLLSSEGETLFVGNADDALAHFAAKKFVLPDHHNTGDYLLLCAEFSSDHLSNAAAVEALKGQPLTVAHAPRRYPRRNQLEQFGLLFQRELLYSVRDHRVLLHRFIGTAITMALTGCVFMHSGDITRPEYFFATHFVSIAYAYFALSLDLMLGGVMLLHEDKVLLIRERSLYSYDLMPVLLSKAIPELVINFIISCEATLILYWAVGWSGNFMYFVLGLFLLLEVHTSYCYFFAFSCASIVKALVLVVLSLVPQLLFYGILVTFAAMPNWLSWINYVCTLTYGLKIAAAQEFVPEHCVGNPYVCAEWVVLTTANGISRDDIWWYCLILALMTVFYRVVAFFAVQLSIWKLR
ncbi:hypothetical protein BASA81_004731 [Batrachochytrium salamandrivorans]|nr:hypothetical protein BASA81_004731 [Batrachochytrium salamandrivorans]